MKIKIFFTGARLLLGSVIHRPAGYTASLPLAPQEPFSDPQACRKYGILLLQKSAEAQ
ncbi:hypothetical protein [Methanomethylovorans sp.]|uniref:hypothetical protein n=1 Tax=Methanomethylovorans sp. TaxID=2758717 RepID=UPI003C76E85A